MKRSGCVQINHLKTTKKTDVWQPQHRRAQSTPRGRHIIERLKQNALDPKLRRVKLIGMPSAGFIYTRDQVRYEEALRMTAFGGGSSIISLQTTSCPGMDNSVERAESYALLGHRNVLDNEAKTVLLAKLPMSGATGGRRKK